MRYFILAGLVAVLACRAATAPGFTGTCRNYQTVAQTVPTVAQTVPANSPTTIVFNRANCPFTTADQLVLPVGTYQIDAQVEWAPNASGSRGACLYVGDIVYSLDGKSALQGNVGTPNHVTATVISDGSTTVRITGSQNSGGPLATLIAADPQLVLTFVSVTRVE